MHSIQKKSEYENLNNTQLFMRSLIKDLNKANVTLKTGILSKRINEILISGKATKGEKKKIFRLWNETYLNQKTIWQSEFYPSFDDSVTCYANKHGE